MSASLHAPRKYPSASRWGGHSGGSEWLGCRADGGAGWLQEVGWVGWIGKY